MTDAAGMGADGDALDDPHAEIRRAVEKVCARFDLDYWRRCDEAARFPAEFFDAIRKDGWLGIMMPPELGGAGLGVGAGATLVQAIAESGAGWIGVATVLGYIYGPHAVVVHGTSEQRQRMLPPLIRGDERPCFGVTEANTGLDTTRVKTRAVRQGDHYLVNGEKVWTTAAHFADRILLLARTTPIEETKRPIDGLSLFYTRVDRKYLDIRHIPKHAGESIGSNTVIIENFPVPAEDLIGEEGKGFRYLIDSINPERILMAAATIGLGRIALARATRYAQERVVFGRPIGQNQSIQHPLAQCWVELEAAQLLTFRAAALYDAGRPCGPEANAAKFLSAEVANRTCRQAVLTHGGFGFAREYHVERYLRESMQPLLAPISPQLLLCNIAERVLGLPKSY